MNDTDYRLSLGTIIWLPVAGVMLLALIGATVLMLVVWRRERKNPSPYSDAGAALGLAALAVFSILCLVGGTAWGMWPYDAEYHQWRDTGGTVEAIDSRLLADGNGGATERFVVTFDDGRQRSCDDTRCAQVQEGDDLTLACKRLWQWAGTHGYDCNYIAHEATR